MKNKLLKIIIPIVTVLAILVILIFAIGGKKRAKAPIASPIDTTLPSSEITILFTHDIHDYYYPTKMLTDKGLVEHGGAARLATLIKQNSNDHSIYVDAGDFSMGTLLQAGYTDATELKILGLLGCSVTTFGNHEFDLGAEGAAKMLSSASLSNQNLPELVCANISFDQLLSEDQKLFYDAFTEYGVKDYIIKEINGVKVAFIGLMGYESIEDAPTSGQNWTDYIETAKNAVAEIGDSADIIVALSHSGTKGDGKTGEDFDLAMNVPEIDVIISGHSHNFYSEPIIVGNTILVSQGCYLEHLGVLNLEVYGKNAVCKDYKLVPIDSSVSEDEEIKAYVEEIKNTVDEEYVSNFGFNFNQVIAYSPFSFSSLNEMYRTHQEYPMGDLIADSYMYESRKQGIDDIDVALVGLGTIRNTFSEGEITTADAFESCSLGVGKDGSVGHPIIGVYVSGKEIKLAVELDASLGPLVSSIKMSYSGLSYTFNEKRMLLDRVTDLCLVRADGSKEKIEDDKLYKVCCNMYAANMLGMLNGLTKGILSISLKAADGSPVTDTYDFSLIDKNGNEIKEWFCLADYLSSFEKGQSGLPTIPMAYSDMQNRKVKVSEGGLAVIAHPGTSTLVVIALPIILICIIVLIIVLVKKHKKNKK